MKVLLVVLDGLADRPWPALGGRTPLGAAHTPNLDLLVSRASTGLLHPLGRGFAPGSELAHMTLFGYPRDAYPGRALFETLGDGLEVEEGTVLYRGLFGTVRREEDATLTLLAHRSDADEVTCAELAGTLEDFEAEGLRLRFEYTKDAQGVLFVEGDASSRITDCDPYLEGLPIPDVRPLEHAADPERAARTARAVRAFALWAHERLAEHPLNRELAERGAKPADFLLLKWGAEARALPPFEHVTGMRGASVSSGTMYRGLTAALGMTWYGTTYLDDWGEDLAARIDTARRAFEEGHTFVHVHTKGPDVAGHTKDPGHKHDVIESLDAGLEGLVGGLLEDAPRADATRADATGTDATGTGADDGVLLALTGDHGTPSGSTLLHSGDAVPLMLVGDRVLPDEVTRFDEMSCARGSLGHLDGWELMPTLLDLSDRIKYMGARLTPWDGIFWPEDYPRLTR